MAGIEPSLRSVRRGAFIWAEVAAGRVAAKKRAAIAVDCVALEFDGDTLVATKTTYAGKMTAKFRLAGDRLQVVTVRSNAFIAAEPVAGATAEVQSVSLSPSDVDKRLIVKEVAATCSGVTYVTEGELGGRVGLARDAEANLRML